MTIWLTEVWRAWRASLRKPGVLLLATGVLALGIGASVAVFSLINGVLLRALPSIANLRSMQSIVQGTTADTRLNLLLIGVFALLALVLAAVGIYAVVSVAVTIREREFGIRAALGASPRRLMQRVLHDGSLQVVLALGIGLVLAFALAWVMQPVLLRIQRNAFDVPVILTVCALLTVVGLLACLPPAMRAGRVQPMQVMRGE